MAKNITIAEGSQAKNFNTVHKLRTNLIGGGTQYWVPEDEAGAYAKMSEKSITANGTYRASDDDKDGYSQVIVNVPPTRPNLTTKTISENGSYRAIDDGADGFSQVYVRVSGEGENTAVLDKPIGGDSNEHYIAVESGKPIDIVLPTSLRIITDPTKTLYKNWQRIDLTGIVVKAYKRDGTLWESEDYPGGIIPLSELIINPTTVDFSKGDSVKTNHNGLNVIELVYAMDGCQSWMAAEKYVNLPTAKNGYLGNRFGYGAVENVGSNSVSDDGAEFYLTRYNDDFYAYGINQDCVIEYRYLRLFEFGEGENKESLTLWGRDYFTTEGARVGVWNKLINFSRNEETSWSVQHGGLKYVPISTIDPMNTEVVNLQWGGKKITVKWKRPNDNKILETTFQITFDVSS